MSLKKAIVLVAVLAICYLNVSAQNKIDIQSKVDSISYAIGYNVGTNLQNQFTFDTIPYKSDLVQEGIKDGILKAVSKIPAEKMNAILMNLQQEIMAKREAQRAEAEKEKKAMGEVNKKKGDEFLAANKTKEGVQTTASGLQYKVIKMGTGPKPTTNNDVKVHYKGTLIDGKVFDSSIDRNEPVTFPVTGVIKGWTEALQLMPEGSKWILYIPSDLAYGDRGAGKDIGPNSTLIFEVELLQVIEKGQGQANQVDTPAVKVAPKKTEKK